MDGHAAKIQEMTLPVVNRLSRLDNVIGIVCFGSHALGTADRYSDIDLFVFCNPDIIAVTIRHTIFANLYRIADLILCHTTPGWNNEWSPQSDAFTLYQTRFEISYNTKDWIIGVVQKVTEEGMISIPEMHFRPYTMLGLLANAIPLYDPQGFLCELSARLYPYPATLRARIIDENLSIMTDGLEELRNYARRGISNTSFLFHLVRVCDALISVLFAINQRYDPATKRPEQEFKKLERLPDNFAVRYETLLEGPFTAKGRQKVVEELAGLIREITQLAVDTNP